MSLKKEEWIKRINVQSCSYEMDKIGVILKEGKEKIFLHRHHWIFSGAISSYPKNYTDGEITPISNHKGKLLGYGYFNRKTALCGRIISFGDEHPDQAIERYIDEAIALRKNSFDEAQTNAYRLINGEGDRLPGLIVDRYDRYLVFQIGTLGMEKLKPKILSLLTSKLDVIGAYEKSSLNSRKEEGLIPFERNIWGNEIDQVKVLEDGNSFLVSIPKGQKTGFFLDQREMRKWISKLSKGKKVLNCFSYSGGFSVYALKGGAIKADSLDISLEAMTLAKENVKANGFDINQHNFVCRDVFEFLREDPLEYDIIILDPPAFAKKKKDVIQACKGYKEINRLALKKIKSGGLVLTCSCSYHVDMKLFQMVIFQAALDAGREVKILGTHRLGSDHPINLFHPETDYLKSLLLYVD